MRPSAALLSITLSIGLLASGGLLSPARGESPRRPASGGDTDDGTARGALRKRLKALVDPQVQPIISSGPASADQAPGGMVAIYVQNERFFFPYGTIDPAGTPPTRDTVFGLGSVTKVLTTAVFGQSTELFDKPVVASAPRPYQLSAAEHTLTFEQLATFTGGISPSDPDTCKHKACSQDEFVAFVDSREPKALPAEVDYSNSSVGFLAQLLVARTGAKDYASAQALQSWYEANLFQPLSMDFTSVAPGKTDPRHPLSAAFAFDAASQSYRVTQYQGWCPWGAAGRVFSTADDMLNFAMAHAGATVVAGQQVPAKLLAGFKEALAPRTPMPNGKGAMQAFAWVAQAPDAATHSTVRVKNGGVPGVSSAVVVNPELGLAVVVLTNMEKVHAVEPAKEIMQALMQLR